jgi:hypothetical protein
VLVILKAILDPMEAVCVCSDNAEAAALRLIKTEQHIPHFNFFLIGYIRNWIGIKNPGASDRCRTIPMEKYMRFGHIKLIKYILGARLSFSQSDSMNIKNHTKGISKTKKKHTSHLLRCLNTMTVT